MKTRYIVSVGIVAVALFSVCFIFWQQELKYSLPTPVPVHYAAVKPGKSVVASVRNQLPSGPLFLHFYNPDCPCSRFNARYIKSLIRSYQDSVKLIIVVPSAESLSIAKREFGEDQQYSVDGDGKIAKACGVYSTPQAALISRDGNLYYRGNYNQSRYCTSRSTNYAEIALISLLNNYPPPQFDLFATESYGCELPQKKTTPFQ